MPLAWMAGAAVLGGGLNYLGETDAAKTQAGAANHAADVQLSMFNRIEGEMQPYKDAGAQSLQAVMKGLGIGDPNATGPVGYGAFTIPFGLQQFQESPAYQFNLQQGKDAIDKAAAARGNFYAPKTLQDMAKFSQGLASNEYQNAFSNYNTSLGNIWNRLTQISGSGQNAVANTGAMGLQSANNQGNYLTQGANASAAGNMAFANSANQAIGGATNAYVLSQILKNNQGGMTPVPGADSWQPVFTGYGGGSPY